MQSLVLLSALYRSRQNFPLSHQTNNDSEFFCFCYQSTAYQEQQLLCDLSLSHYLAVKQTIKQLVRRSSRPTRRDTCQGRVSYEPKKAPPFTLHQLTRMCQFCLRTAEVFMSSFRMQNTNNVTRY